MYFSGNTNITETYRTTTSQVNLIEPTLQSEGPSHRWGGTVFFSQYSGDTRYQSEILYHTGLT